MSGLMRMETLVLFMDTNGADGLTTMAVRLTR